MEHLCMEQNNKTKRAYFIRWSFFLIGLIVLALGISITIKAENLGIGPWDVFHYGLWENFGLTIGSWSIIAGFVILAVTAILSKSLPKIGAFLNMLLIGVFIDLFLLILPTPQHLVGQWVMLLVGIIVLGYGIGLYVSADLGAGPRDSLMLVVTEKTGWKVQWVRNMMEVIVFIIGWLLGGPVGIGTVLIAFILGPVVGYSLPVCKKILTAIINRGEKNENFNKGSIRVNDYDRVSKETR
jgi:uncharacterized protein